MRKLLLLLSFILASFYVIAQNECEVNNDFKNLKYQKDADNIVTLTWQYARVERNDIFYVYRYENNDGESTEFAVKRIYATDPCEFKQDTPAGQTPEKEDPTAQTTYSCTLYGLDMSGSINYTFAIEVEKKLSDGSTQKTRVHIKQEGQNFVGVASEGCATPYSYTYGLKWKDPALTNKKSQSVTLNWEPYSKEGRYLYTVFGVEHNKVFSTTSETSATITYLESGVRHSFQIRAYDEQGNYLATTSIIDYEPEVVLCLTFPEVNVSNNTVTLTILDFGNGFDDNRESYTLINDEEAIACSNIDKNIGKLTFSFVSINYNEEFRLETKRKVEGQEVKAVGLFRLNPDRTLATQYCDIVFDLAVTHITQHTVKLEWSDPGFVPTEAVLQYRTPRGEPKTIELANPRASVYDLGGLEHSTQYTFVLTLSDNYKNEARAEVTATTKVGSICGLENINSGSNNIGCGNGEFLMPYDLEFYTAYHDQAKKDPYVVVRFKPLGAKQINDVKLYATTERGWISDIVGLTTKEMKKGEDGWYSCELDKLGWISWAQTDIKDDLNIRFAVSVKHNDGCRGELWQNNTYVTKFASYKVGIGCQDDAIFTILEFEKLYPQQTQYTLQTNGRIASVGVFPEHGYNKANGSFDLNTRIFYNSFDDAPSSFTLDISDPQKFPVGKYYVHIHDVYGEAEGLKYLWAIY